MSDSGVVCAISICCIDKELTIAVENPLNDHIRPAVTVNITYEHRITFHIGIRAG